MTPLTRYLRDEAAALERRIGRRYQPRAEPVAELGDARVYRREPFLSRRGDTPQGAGKIEARVLKDDGPPR